MNKQKIIKELKSLNQVEKYKEKAWDKVRYWQDRQESVEERLAKLVNDLDYGEFIIVGENLISKNQYGSINVSEAKRL